MVMKRYHVFFFCNQPLFQMVTIELMLILILIMALIMIGTFVWIIKRSDPDLEEDMERIVDNEEHLEEREVQIFTISKTDTSKVT